MKHVKKVYLILILFICNSCQNEDDFEMDTNSLRFNLQENINKKNSTKEINDEFETQMHWVSFLIAKAIHDSAEAEQLFINSFQSIGTSTSRVVSLHTLLDPSYLNNEFERAFEAAFLYYFLEASNCPSNDRKPRGGPKPPGSIGGCPLPNMRCSEGYYQLFLQFLMEDNCLEIYLPNGYDSRHDQIHTTAHPLTNFGANEGYVMPEDCDNDLTISPFNLHFLNNVIVTRPFRDRDRRCDYSKYSHVEDFSIFLHQ